MKFLKQVIMICFALSTTIAIAADENNNSAAVNKSTCSKFANTTKPFVLVLSSGDNLIESITQCAKDAKLIGASVNGLGQLHDPVLAYFSSDPNAKPTLTKLIGFFELASLNGNITNNSGKYYTHLHAALADKQFHGIAGHINEAKVGLTVEITIIPLPAPLERTVDPKTGFGPIIN